MSRRGRARFDRLLDELKGIAPVWAGGGYLHDNEVVTVTILQSLRDFLTRRAPFLPPRYAARFPALAAEVEPRLRALRRIAIDRRRRDTQPGIEHKFDSDDEEEDKKRPERKVISPVRTTIHEDGASTSSRVDHNVGVSLKYTLKVTGYREGAGYISMVDVVRADVKHGPVIFVERNEEVNRRHLSNIANTVARKMNESRNEQYRKYTGYIMSLQWQLYDEVKQRLLPLQSGHFHINSRKADRMGIPRSERGSIYKTPARLWRDIDIGDTKSVRTYLKEMLVQFVEGRQLLLEYIDEMYSDDASAHYSIDLIRVQFIHFPWIYNNVAGSKAIHLINTAFTDANHLSQETAQFILSTQGMYC